MKLVDHIKMYLYFIFNKYYFVQIHKFKVLYTVSINGKHHLKFIVFKKMLDITHFFGTVSFSMTTK